MRLFTDSTTQLLSLGYKQQARKASVSLHVPQVFPVQELCALHAPQSMTPGALSAFLGRHIVTAAGVATGGCTEELRGLRRSSSLSRHAPCAAWGATGGASSCPSEPAPGQLPAVVLLSREDSSPWAPLPALAVMSPPAPACSSDAWWGEVMSVGFCAAGRLEVIRMTGSRRGLG